MRPAPQPRREPHQRRDGDVLDALLDEPEEPQVEARALRELLLRQTQLEATPTDVGRYKEQCR